MPETTPEMEKEKEKRKDVWSASSAFDENLALTESKLWVEAVTGETVKGDLISALQNGTLLCRLVNHIKPGVVKKYHKMAGSLFFQLENINFFLDACKSLGLREEVLFDPKDLHQRQNFRAITNTLYWLGRVAFTVGFRGPQLGFANFVALQCSICSKEIKSNDVYVIDLVEQYHVSCLKCTKCNNSLNPDEDYHIEDMKSILCENCYDIEENGSSVVEAVVQPVIVVEIMEQIIEKKEVKVEEIEEKIVEEEKKKGEVPIQVVSKEESPAPVATVCKPVFSRISALRDEFAQDSIPVAPQPVSPAPKAQPIELSPKPQMNPIVKVSNVPYYPEKEGFLLACKGFKNKWKKHYVVLNNGNLQFFIIKNSSGDKVLSQSFPAEMLGVAGIVTKQGELPYAIISSNPAMRVSIPDDLKLDLAQKVQLLKEWSSALHRTNELYLSRSRRIGVVKPNRRLSSGQCYTKDISTALSRNVTAQYLYVSPDKGVCNNCGAIGPTWKYENKSYCLGCSEAVQSAAKKPKRKKTLDTKAYQNEINKIVKEDRMMRQLERERALQKRRLNILSQPIKTSFLVVEATGQKERIRSQAFEQLSICSTACNISDNDTDEDVDFFNDSDDEKNDAGSSALASLGISAYSISRKKSSETFEDERHGAKSTGSANKESPSPSQHRKIAKTPSVKDGLLTPPISKWQRNLTASMNVDPNGTTQSESISITVPIITKSPDGSKTVMAANKAKANPKNMELVEDKYDKMLGEEEDDEKKPKINVAEEGDWNKRFQSIMHDISTFSINTPEDDQISANLALIGLVHDFMYSAKNYGKTIITEVYLPDKDKTIKPTNLGGAAGGSKYIVHNILFKFALDTDGLYDGDDSLAAKVAGHEIMGLQAYFNCNIRGLCLPLMALVDYRGFRVIAMSKLPINRSTIIYGTNDGGQTIHNDRPTLSDMMRRTAEILNIKPHMAGLFQSDRKMIYSAADLEGHRGTDCRYYLVDFSRTFPCETPDQQTSKGENLTKLLRPELVKQYPFPLCPDAYSNFTDRSHNDEIDQATSLLQWEYIPRFARDLPELVKNGGGVESFRLTEALHARGINIRWIGAVYLAVNNATQSSDMKNDLKTLLLQEMYARVIKNDLRKRLRTRMKKKKLPLEEPYRMLVVDYLNLVFGNTSMSAEYWENHLLPLVEQTYAGVQASSLKQLVADRDRRLRRKSGLIGKKEKEKEKPKEKKKKKSSTRTISDGNLKKQAGMDGNKLSHSAGPKKFVSSGNVTRKGRKLMSMTSSESKKKDKDSIQPVIGKRNANPPKFPSSPELKRRANTAPTWDVKSGEFEKISDDTIDINDHPATIVDCYVKRAVCEFSSSDCSGMLMLLRRVQAMVGFSWNAKCEEKLEGIIGSAPAILTRSDLDQIGERVKHMNIVLQVEGYLLMMKAIATQSVDPASSISYYQMAIAKFEEELRSNPNSKVTLRNCARALVGQEEEECQITGRPMNIDSPRCCRAFELFAKAIRLDPTDPLTMFQYARFFDRIGRTEMAEDYYLDVLEMDPSFVEALHAYGSLLQSLGDFEWAEKMFERVLQITSSI